MLLPNIFFYLLFLKATHQAELYYILVNNGLSLLLFKFMVFRYINILLHRLVIEIKTIYIFSFFMVCLLVHLKIIFKLFIN